MTADKKPDLSFLINATKTVANLLKKGDFVIYESTVYPGCTEEDCIPILESLSGLKYNTDFFCGYSPERINPGDKVNTYQNRVTSGSTPEAAETVDALYQSIIEVEPIRHLPSRWLRRPRLSKMHNETSIFPLLMS